MANYIVRIQVGKISPMHFDVPPADRHAAITTVAMPKDTNSLGDIFGGWLMSHADIAGAVSAYGRARGRVVTVAVNEFLFISPVYVGDLVSFYTDIRHIGNTSIQVDVTMFAQNEWGTPNDERRVASATLTYVHIDSQRRPRSIVADEVPSNPI